MSALRRLLLGLAGLALLGAGLLWQINFNDGVDTRSSAPVASDAATRARGAYLARAGNCLACHTARGGPAAAGGRPIA
ncbi:MAG TPA: cytochrome c, partial [Ottowia sp.]|nr:cytochrome c [Ottowia sp.]